MCTQRRRSSEYDTTARARTRINTQTSAEDLHSGRGPTQDEDQRRTRTNAGRGLTQDEDQHRTRIDALDEEQRRGRGSDEDKHTDEDQRQNTQRAFARAASVDHHPPSLIAHGPAWTTTPMVLDANHNKTPHARQRRATMARDS
ncbi:hypothetical protein BDZ89DRAFT_1107309 [Hymenopellis radicata]|nr:hypothetical protein BDZ89DRAFT_1107309 [Hymenopellis radicata]